MTNMRDTLPERHLYQQYNLLWQLDYSITQAYGILQIVYRTYKESWPL